MITDLYYLKIIHGDLHHGTQRPWTIDDVPSRWREDVRKQLESIEQSEENDD